MDVSDSFTDTLTDTLDDRITQVAETMVGQHERKQARFSQVCLVKLIDCPGHRFWQKVETDEDAVSQHPSSS